MIIGTDYWRQLIDFIEQMAERGKISSSDLQLIETFQPNQTILRETFPSGL